MYTLNKPQSSYLKKTEKNNKDFYKIIKNKIRRFRKFDKKRKYEELTTSNIKSNDIYAITRCFKGKKLQ